ncbi:MAG: GbsR/MarR family transcriptional regulator [Yoonia sp.]|uniref:GbsR/MarR family transcriptional regulator n=1 Tax=Yoonia sp. TaxID=2212373 RepID=UPI003EF48653
MSDDPSYAETRSEFIEKTGLITQAEGLPRIAGRVFGMLIFDGDMVSFGDLATRLQVSRASISTSIRMLEERGLIKRVTKPGERQDYFQLAPNPYATMLEGLKKRTMATCGDIADTIQKLPPECDAVERLNAYAHFYALKDKVLDVALAELNTTSSANLKDETHD